MENQAIQNPTPEPSLTPFQVSESKAKFPAMYLVLSLFILVLLASTVFLYYQNKQLKNILTNYQTPPAVSPTPSPIPTASPPKITNGTICQTDTDCDNGFFCMASNCIKSCNTDQDCEKTQQCKAIDFYSGFNNNIPVTKKGCE